MPHVSTVPCIYNNRVATSCTQVWRSRFRQQSRCPFCVSQLEPSATSQSVSSHTPLPLRHLERLPKGVYGVMIFVRGLCVLCLGRSIGSDSIISFVVYYEFVFLMSLSLINQYSICMGLSGDLCKPWRPRPLQTSRLHDWRNVQTGPTIALRR
jgi:hypothetical protein